MEPTTVAILVSLGVGAVSFIFPLLFWFFTRETEIRNVSDPNHLHRYDDECRCWMCSRAADRLVNPRNT